jgi:hypothetical protein
MIEIENEAEIILAQVMKKIRNTLEEFEYN